MAITGTWLRWQFVRQRKKSSSRPASCARPKLPCPYLREILRKQHSPKAHCETLLTIIPPASCSETESSNKTPAAPPDCTATRRPPSKVDRLALKLNDHHLNKLFTYYLRSGYLNDSAKYFRLSFKKQSNDSFSFFVVTCHSFNLRRWSGFEIM